MDINLVELEFKFQSYNVKKININYSYPLLYLYYLHKIQQRKTKVTHKKMCNPLYLLTIFTIYHKYALKFKYHVKFHKVYSITKYTKVGN